MIHITKTNTAPKAIPTIAPVDIFDDDEGGALGFAVVDGVAVGDGDGGESGSDVAGVVGGDGGEYEYGAAVGLPAEAFDITENKIKTLPQFWLLIAQV